MAADDTVVPVCGCRRPVYWPLEHQYFIRTVNAINDGKHETCCHVR